MSSWQVTSRPNKLLFWSLVVLGVAMVIAVAFAIRRFNRDIADGGVPNTSVTNTSQDANAPLKDGDIAQPELRTFPGFVSEVIARDTSEEKWVKLSVKIPDASMPSTDENNPPEKVEMKETTYLFYVGANTEGAASIHGGELAVFSSYNEPSEKEYVAVEKVLVIQPSETK